MGTHAIGGNWHQFDSIKSSKRPIVGVPDLFLPTFPRHFRISKGSNLFHDLVNWFLVGKPIRSDQVSSVSHQQADTLAEPSQAMSRLMPQRYDALPQCRSYRASDRFLRI